MESGSTTGRQINALDHGAAVRQQLGLDLRADAQLTIQAFVAAPVLLENLVLQGHPGEIGHELEVAAIHLAPAVAPPATEDIQASPLAIARHDGGSHHLGRTHQATNQGIQRRHDSFPTCLGRERAIGEGGDLPQHLATTIASRGLEMVSPQPAVVMEDHQQAALGLHQPRGGQGDQFKKALQVGKAAQGKGEGSQHLLIATLFATEAVEQLAQGQRRRQSPLGYCRAGPLGGRGRGAGRRSTQKGAAKGFES